MSSRAIDLQWGESGLNLYNSNKLTFLLCHITPICVANTSVSAISQTPWNTSTLSKSCLAPASLKLIRLYPCGSLRQSISFIFGAWAGCFAVTPRIDVVGTGYDSKDCPGQVTYSVGQVKICGLPDEESHYQFFYWQHISSIRFWVTVTVFLSRFHNRNISFLLHHQTDWLQCRSMWLACQCS